jgi:hypothetical protein
VIIDRTSGKVSGTDQNCSQINPRSSISFHYAKGIARDLWAANGGKYTKKGIFCS